MLAETRGALAALLQAKLPDMQVSAYLLANPTPPCMHIFPAGTDYDQAMGRGLDTWTFTLQAFVGETSDIGAQVLLDQLLEPSGAMSIKDAIDAGTVDGTLGGLIFDATIIANTGYQRYQVEGRGLVVGSEWTIQVLASGVGGG